MMRQALGCTKMKRLCRNLGIPSYAAVGILESLWHLTARETPQGNIGKLSNEDIALAIDWSGDEDKLICELLASEWLDSDETHRLIVHDWHQHSDDAVDNYLARRGFLYANGARPRMNRLSVQEKAALCARFQVLCAQNPTPCAVPVTSNQIPDTSNQKPEPDTSNQKPEPELDFEPAAIIGEQYRGRSTPLARPTPIDLNQPTNGAARIFLEWWKLWSSIRGTNHKEFALQAFAAEITPNTFPDLMDCTRSYLAGTGADTSSGYNPENFIRDQAVDQYRARWPARKLDKKAAAKEIFIDRMTREAAREQERKTQTGAL
jgi:hypothetical protein